MKDFCFVCLLPVLAAVSCTLEKTCPEGAGEWAGAAPAAAVSVTGVNLEPRNVNMYVGQSVKLTATVRPSNATDKRLRWTCTMGCVSVSQEGVVTAMTKGYATVTVHTLDGDYQSSIRVTSTFNNVSAVEFLSPGEIVLTRGERFDMQALAVGEDRLAPPSFRGLEWSSSAPQTVAVDPSTGRATAMSSGEAYVTATSSSDTSKSASCRVVVLNAGPAAEGGVGFRSLDP